MSDAGVAKARFVPIPDDRLRAGLGAWGLSDAPISPLPRGASGEVFVVEDPAGVRRVAKYAYMARHDFEPGLLAAEFVAEFVAAGGLRAATPERTQTGELVAMVEWPGGVEHPLALLTWIEGEPLDPTTSHGATSVGRTLGHVQALLADAGRERLGLTDDRDYLAYLRGTDQDLGTHGWLHGRIAELVAEVDDLAATAELTWAPGVWDGPEIVVDEAGGLGLIDFGNVDWHPIAHAVAYGTTQVAPPGRERTGQVETFIGAFIEEYALTPADLAAVPAFRLITLAIYAKFMATRLATGRLDRGLEGALDRCLAALR